MCTYVDGSSGFRRSTAYYCCCRLTASFGCFGGAVRGAAKRQGRSLLLLHGPAGGARFCALCRRTHSAVLLSLDDVVFALSHACCSFFLMRESSGGCDGRGRKEEVDRSQENNMTPKYFICGYSACGIDIRHPSFTTEYPKTLLHMLWRLGRRLQQAIQAAYASSFVAAWLKN